ncbi:glutamate receptor 3 isoform X2 [Lutzomyia longipalpis]|uniref:glutamate receptor 3 isoform X2 n=1 Tax=Lutzomyia longipalpis TaxID=7200 RepID=UPI0024841B61|nr:glutamate receptor 3 isoform X2 [Lutzomyia longipalpis]XP_055688086.1 glutamate receptor 3 isoform X2 [Lutzomyia longipalpis]
MVQFKKMIVPQIVILSIFLGYCHAQETVSFVIIHEEQEKHIPQILGRIFKGLEESSSNAITISDRYISYNYETSNFEQQFCSVATNGVSIVLNLLWGKFQEISEFVKSQGVPYIEADISVFPFVRIVELYLRKQSAVDCVYIVTSEEEVDQVLFGMIGYSNIRMNVLNNLGGTSIQRLQNLRPNPSYYAVIATTEKMNEILSMALNFKLIQRPDKWNLVFKDSQQNLFRYHDAFKEATKLVVDQSFCCRWLNQHDTCTCTSDFTHVQYFLKEIVERTTQLLRSNNIPKIEVKCGEGNATSSVLDASSALQDQLITSLDGNQLIYMIPENDEIKFHLNATIQTTETPYAGDEVATVGRYVDEEVFGINGASLARPTKPFLRIGVTESVPWTFHLGRDQNGNDMWTGYCVDLIDFIAKRMDFDYEIVRPKTGTFGKNLGNGKWDGLVGDLVTGDIDIAVAAIKMTAEREEVIDFVAPYFEQTGISIVMRKPVRQTSLFKFMTVLRLEVWLSIVAALVATAILIWFLDKYSPYSARNNKEAYPYPCRDFTLKESFWFALTSFTPQGGGEAPKALSGRTLVAAYWLFVVLMMATFTANLAAFLTVERMQTPVQSLEQLARQSRINYTVVEGSDTHSYFINMKFAEDTLYRVWKEITLNSTSDQSQYRVWDYPIKEQYGNILMAINGTGPVANSEEGFRQVNEHINADFAFIHDSSEIKYEISRSCNLTEVGEEFGKQPYAIAVQQGSHLQDQLCMTILELQKDRVFENLKAKYWNNSIKGQCPDDDENEGISLESLGGVFIATLAGLAIALITLAGEVLYYKRKNRSAIRQVQPFETPKKEGNLEKNLQNFTIGDKFVPVGEKGKPVSYISVYPRKSIHNYGEYIE